MRRSGAAIGNPSEREKEVMPGDGDAQEKEVAPGDGGGVVAWTSIGGAPCVASERSPWSIGGGLSCCGVRRWIGQ
ncbi:hypothetical protein U1Q18_048158 [Sarracenia purpurea var. burkii]